MSRDFKRRRIALDAAFASRAGHKSAQPQRKATRATWIRTFVPQKSTCRAAGRAAHSLRGRWEVPIARVGKNEPGVGE